MSNVKPVPQGFHSLTPHVTVRGAAEAIEFYKKAFGAQERYRMPGPGGKIMHAELQIGDSILMLNDAMPEMGGPDAPKSGEKQPCSIMLYCENVDNMWQQAVAAGAKPTMELQNQFWGDRYGKLTDPFGHCWSLAQHVEDVSPEEMKKRMEQMSKHMAGSHK